MASVCYRVNKLGIYYFNPLRATARSIGQWSVSGSQHKYFDCHQTDIRWAATQNLTYKHWLRPGSVPAAVISINRRHNHNESGPPPPSRNKLPRLMSFPQIIWPSVFKTIKNWIMVNFIVRPYFDNDFQMADFVAGTKHALQVTDFI